LKILRKIQLFLRNQPRYIAWFLKGLVTFLFGLLLWYEIFQRENFDALKAVFLAELRGENTIWLYLTLFLMPINWATETLKWLPLIKLTEPISFKTGYKAVLAGVTFSLFMPNRVGEFGGRILFLRRRNALKGVFSTFVGSWAQQTVLITFGFLGFAYFLIDLWKVELFVLQAVIFIGLITIALLFFVFLNLEIVVPIFKKIRFLYRFPRLIKGVSVIRQYKRRDLAKTLMWAFIRYAIYSLQYYMMLRFFGIDVPILRGLACIATIYLLQTSIPLPPVVSLLARGEVAIKIWGLFQANEMSILAATFT
jgi:Lysylphosphatidylglycerol synthase TM region